MALECFYQKTPKPYMNVRVDSLTSDSRVQDSVLPAGQPVRTTTGGVLSTGPINLGSSDVTGTLPTSSLSGTIAPSSISPAPTITPGLNLTTGTSSW